MKFGIDLTKVGCGQKAPMDIIVSAADYFDSPGLSDAQSSGVIGDDFLFSIDRVGGFTAEPKIFCDCAVLHCVGDILVSGGIPLSSTACIDFGPEYRTSEEIIDLSDQLRTSLTSSGVELTNVHSIFSDYTYITLSVTGIQSTRIDIPTKSGKVFLSRKIGAFKMLLVSELQELPYRRYVDEIIEGRLRRPTFGNVAMTDITGFGLAGALFSLARRCGARIVVELTSEHIVSEEVGSVPMSCLEASQLPDKYIHFDGAKSERIATCAEVAGPAVFLVEERFLEKFVYSHSYAYGITPKLVGSFTIDGEAGVDVRWKD